jgi:hypothetical protein
MKNAKVNPRSLKLKELQGQNPIDLSPIDEIKRLSISRQSKINSLEGHDPITLSIDRKEIMYPLNNWKTKKCS